MHIRIEELAVIIVLIFRVNAHKFKYSQSYLQATYYVVNFRPFHHIIACDNTGDPSYCRVYTMHAPTAMLRFILHTVS